MEIREATQADIPEIVKLLKLSLGESLMPKSEQYWRWKHLENPFGKSPVLVCFEGQDLAGVRAFMRWDWIQDGKVYNALRAVDTATHPASQGKGIFKKLTLSLVDYCKGNGDHFIFNTPNLKSMPGYLKMGWKQAGKLPVRVGIQRPFSMLRHFISNDKKQTHTGRNDRLKYYLQHNGLNALLADHHGKASNLTTNVSIEYLKWRYENVPVTNYVAIGSELDGLLSGLIFGRIKQTRIGIELRITDYFVNGDIHDNGLSKWLMVYLKEWRIDYITISGVVSRNFSQLFPGLNIKTSWGPMVTVRGLSMIDLDKFNVFNQWSPSLGDLELF